MWHCRITGPIALGCCIKDLKLVDVWVQSDDVETPAGRALISGVCNVPTLIDIPVLSPDDTRLLAVLLPQVVLWERMPDLGKLSLFFYPEAHREKFAMYPSGVRCHIAYAKTVSGDLVSVQRYLTCTCL